MTAAPNQSKPLNVKPTAKWVALMGAMDAWIKTVETTWDDGAEALAAMLPALTYADSTCRACRHIPNRSELLNFPHIVEEESPHSWRAHYLCTGCGHTYSVGWADAGFINAFLP